MLLQIPNMLTAAQVAALRVRLETADAPWVDGRATAGHTGAPVKFNQQIDERAAMARELGDVVLAALERNPLFISAALPQRVYPPLFNRYGVGMSFGAHVDGSVRLLPGSGQKIRTDLSATLFLNAPEDYDNGELQIEDTCGLQRIRLAAGDMVLYPASSLHRVTEVTRGTRMACFFWIQSMVRDDGRRTLLFDLDRAIQRLLATGADQTACVGLTGVYHNLLRQWAEP
ncbi:Fe2+-dependent dioxygenase [Metallibacterium scheffleri]|uniref:Fe2+-dependent dioxygenase n=1 Tax=Metallibacterium scheffleri TaxID=993689 RepID=A0A4S3KHX7_9GAMM|nr:Fe2+-dependent dioxygenase [Metallibacterium scheffleri]THD08332.1 Fe2+-dependent dioxygenase [Metallibacterium scheffleri]